MVRYIICCLGSVATWGRVRSVPGRPSAARVRLPVCVTAAPVHAVLLLLTLLHFDVTVNGRVVYTECTYAYYLKVYAKRTHVGV